MSNLTTIKNKIDWNTDNRGCVANFGTQSKPDLHSMSWFPCKIYGTGANRNLVLRTDWHLVWEKVSTIPFGSETELKEYIVRAVYGIRDGILVPSELLYDAGITYYNTTVWVDSWATPKTKETKYDLYNGVAGVNPPADRLIRLSSINKEVQKKAAASRAYYSKRERCRIPPHTEGTPRIIPVDPDWEDFSWEGRVMGRLAALPKEWPSDDACTYSLDFPLLTPEVKAKPI